MKPVYMATAAAAASLSLLALRCSEGAPARPDADAGPIDVVSSDVTGVDVVDAGASAADVAVKPAYTFCADAMAPTFQGILTQMFQTSTCGAAQPYDCHSSTGALPKAEGGTGSLLDFSLDAATIYAELLGDGGGALAANVAGEAGSLLRVVPGDADASLLYVKLAMPSARDPRYGAAMPPLGLLCPESLDAVKAWIADGAAP